MLSKQLAVNLSPICHRKFRQPGVLEIDRMLVRVLNQNAPRFESSYLYGIAAQVKPPEKEYGNRPTKIANMRSWAHLGG